MIGKRRLSVFKKSREHNYKPGLLTYEGEMPKSGGKLFISQPSEHGESSDNFLEKLYNILPAKYHPSVHNHQRENRDTLDAYYNDEEKLFPDRLFSYGKTVVDPQTIIAAHHKMANTLKKHLDDNKNNTYLPSLGPHHDSFIEEGKTHEEYGNELLPYLLLDAPLKMYNFITSHKGDVSKVKEDFIKHLQQDPKTMNPITLDYMNMLNEDK